MSLNVDYLLRTADKLERLWAAIGQADEHTHREQQDCNDVLAELYRDDVIRAFELSLETVCKLLRKALKAFTGNPRSVDGLVFNDVLRHAGKHCLFDCDGVERWIAYRANLNDNVQAGSDGVTHQILPILPQYVADVRVLATKIQAVFDAAT